jgi:hypothetical protein
VNADQLGRIIRETLDHSAQVEIDGLGVFTRGKEGRISFKRARGPRVFIAYAIEDLRCALELFEALENQGYEPWIDRRKLLPGQNWLRRIEDAISSSDFFIACFSRNSAQKRGGFQAEIRHALECTRRMPLDDVFMIPVRLDDCRVPRAIERETQYVDLFPSFETGFDRIVDIIEGQLRAAA